MFDQLLQLVRENAGDAIVSNPSIPNEHNDQAIATASDSIVNTLKQQFASGGFDQIKNLFAQGSDVQSHPLVQNIAQNAMGGLMERFGIDQNAASGVVQKLIPTVMEKFVQKTNDPNDSSFDLNTIAQSLGGQGIGNMLGNLFH